MNRQSKPVNPAEKKPNRVWIELERPRKLPRGQVNEHGGATDLEHAKEICDLANSLLQRLDPGTPFKFFWNSRFCGYSLITSEAQTFMDLCENGHWLNLDYLGRPLEMSAEQWSEAQCAMRRAEAA